MAIKSHQKPCFQCRFYQGLGKGYGLCQRPVVAQTCPVMGLKITTLNRCAHSERNSEWSLFGRQKCGWEGRYHSSRAVLGSPPPPQRGK